MALVLPLPVLSLLLSRGVSGTALRCTAKRGEAEEGCGLLPPPLDEDIGV
jgi:hypothetical protein